MAVAKYIESPQFQFGEDIKSEIAVTLVSQTGKTVHTNRAKELDNFTVAELGTKYDSRFKEQ